MFLVRFLILRRNRVAIASKDGQKAPPLLHRQDDLAGCFPALKHLQSFRRFFQREAGRDPRADLAVPVKLEKLGDIFRILGGFAHRKRAPEDADYLTAFEERQV